MLFLRRMNFSIAAAAVVVIAVVVVIIIMVIVDKDDYLQKRHNCFFFLVSLELTMVLLCFYSTIRIYLCFHLT